MTTLNVPVPVAVPVGGAIAAMVVKVANVLAQRAAKDKDDLPTRKKIV